MESFKRFKVKLFLTFLDALAILASLKFTIVVVVSALRCQVKRNSEVKSCVLPSPHPGRCLYGQGHDAGGQLWQIINIFCFQAICNMSNRPCYVLQAAIKCDIGSQRKDTKLYSSQRVIHNFSPKLAKMS